jgi:hypothetical protein
VAKVVFLLQQVGAWLPCKVENISALLYPRLGGDRNELENDVKGCLEELKRGRWIVEEEGKYRFLSEIERTFEQDVERQPVNETEKREVAQQLMANVLDELTEYNHQNLRTLNVRVGADGKEVSTTGYLKLEFYSPLRSLKQTDLLDSAKTRSLANHDTIYWICKPDEKFESLVEQLIRRKKAITSKEQSATSPQEIKALDKHKKDIDSLADDDLPRLLRNCASEGTVVSDGEDRSLTGTKNMTEIFNEEMKVLASEVFPEFKYAAFLVEKDEQIGAILSWQGGRLPRIYRDLQLVDEQGEIHPERPVPSRIMAEVRRRGEMNPDDQSGSAISNHFEAPPYGWDPRIVRLSLATLFKNNSITVTLEGKVYGSASEGRAQDAFTSARVFNRARFLPGREITPELRNKASQLISKIFGEKGGNSLEEVDKALESVLTNRLQLCARLATVANERGLPQREKLDHLQNAMQHVLDSGSKGERILAFLEKEYLAVIQDGVPVLTNLSKFEPNLNSYYKVRKFAATIAPQLIGDERSEALEKKIRELQDNVNADDFYSRWATTFSLYQDLSTKYYKAYEEKHKLRNQKVKEALAALRLHPAFKELREPEKEQFMSPLDGLSCGSTSLAMDEEDLVCKKCRASLSDLAHHLEMVQVRKQSIRQSLDEAWRKAHKGEELAAVAGFSSVIKATPEIGKVAERLQAVSEVAIKKGKSVRVEVDVE